MAMSSCMFASFADITDLKEIYIQCQTMTTLRLVGFTFAFFQHCPSQADHRERWQSLCLNSPATLGAKKFSFPIQLTEKKLTSTPFDGRLLRKTVALYQNQGDSSRFHSRYADRWKQKEEWPFELMWDQYDKSKIEDNEKSDVIRRINRSMLFTWHLSERFSILTSQLEWNTNYSNKFQPERQENKSSLKNCEI